MARRAPRNMLKVGKVWYGRVWIDGKEHRRSLRTGDRAEAEARVAEWREQIARIRWTGGERPTFQKATVQWAQGFIESGSVKPGTAKRYLVSARVLHPHFHALHLDEITKRTVAAFVAGRQQEGASNATIRRDLTVLTSILESAEDAGWIEENPARTFSRRKIKERRSPKRPPTAERIQIVLDAAPPAFRRLILFAAQMGCRLEEAGSLEWRDVDLKAGAVTFVETKTNRPRTVRLTTPGGDARPALDLPRITQDGEGRVLQARLGFVFGPAPGRRFKNLSSNFAQLTRRVEREEAAAGRSFERFRFHDLRHAFAVRWLLADTEIYRLQNHLGHASVTTTEIYSAWATAERDRMTDRMTPAAAEMLARMIVGEGDA